jgi:hypothetical protein
MEVAADQSSLTDMWLSFLLNEAKKAEIAEYDDEERI